MLPNLNFFSTVNSLCNLFIFKMDNQQDQLYNKGNSTWCYVVAQMEGEFGESLCCSPETITALLTGSTPIQNNKFNKKEKEREKIKTNKK